MLVVPAPRQNLRPVSGGLRHANRCEHSKVKEAWLWNAKSRKKIVPCLLTRFTLEWDFDRMEMTKRSIQNAVYQEAVRAVTRAAPAWTQWVRSKTASVVFFKFDLGGFEI